MASTIQQFFWVKRKSETFDASDTKFTENLTAQLWKTKEHAISSSALKPVISKNTSDVRHLQFRKQKTANLDITHRTRSTLFFLISCSCVTILTPYGPHSSYYQRHEGLSNHQVVSYRTVPQARGTNKQALLFSPCTLLKPEMLSQDMNMWRYGEKKVLIFLPGKKSELGTAIYSHICKYIYRNIQF